MKSQTKALLASVMVLALALSSIGGVTYSWFSDIQTTNVEVSTAQVQFNYQITIGSDSETILRTETTSVDENNAVLGNVDLKKGFAGVISVKITNTGTIPIDVSSTIQYDRYYAVEGSSAIGEVNHILNAESGEESFETTSARFHSNFWTTWKDWLKFGLDYLGILDQGWGKNYGPQNISCSDEEISRYTIYYRPYTYNIGDITLGVGETKTLHLAYKTDIKFDSIAIPSFDIVMECTQSNSVIEQIVDGSATSSIDALRPLYFIGDGYNVMISKEALAGITSVEIRTASTQIGVEVTYFNGGTKQIPAGGEVIIFFEDDTRSYSIRTPANIDSSGGIYKIITEPETGSS